MVEALRRAGRGRPERTNQLQLDDAIAVKYGIEKYYVPENTGQALEEKADRLIVHLKVAPWGQAAIQGWRTEKTERKGADTRMPACNGECSLLQ